MVYGMRFMDLIALPYNLHLTPYTLYRIPYTVHRIPCILYRIFIEGVTMREPFIDFMKTELTPETVLIACGLPASYKTETTEVIAKIKGYHVLRTDMIRLEVL